MSERFKDWLALGFLLSFALLLGYMFFTGLAVIIGVR